MSSILPIIGRICRDNKTRQGQTGPSSEAEVRRIASNLDGVREWSKGGNADCRDAINRVKAAEGRKRNKAKRLCNSLWDAEAQRYSIIAEIQGLRRHKHDFDWRILGYRGTRGYNQSRPILTAEVDEGRQDDALEKQ